MLTKNRTPIFLSLVITTLLVSFPLHSLFLVNAQSTAMVSEQSAFLQDEQNTIDVIGTYSPSVVAVNVEIKGQRLSALDNQNFPPDFFQGQVPNQPQLQHGAGSGFVIDAAGRIVTNYHVVADALQNNSIDLSEGSKLSVTFASNPDQELAVKVIGVNPSYDLALLELQTTSDLPKGVKAIPIANSDALKVGQKVIAIGNPFGLESTVTTGIISGVGRDMQSIGQFTVPMVQTDAAINPGNSGGPLLNSKGELIGINTAIIPSVSVTGERGFLGVGFAVPSNFLNDNLATLEQGGFNDVYSSKPRMGVQVLDISNYPEDVRTKLNLPSEGEMVIAVQEGSPAAKAGLKASSMTVTVSGQELPVGGDIILAVNGEALTPTINLQTKIFSMMKGDTVNLTVWRDGKEQTLAVTLEIVPLIQAQEPN
jgi:serine protease Do